jgi:ElaB/YqjD/DUF883 family membrane-anchored ribosome-binding protein
MSTRKAGGRTGSTSTTTAATAPPPPADDPDAIRADIEQTRAELGDSVQALAGRADVKSRAKEKVAEVKDEATQVVKEQAAHAKDHAKDTAQAAALRAKGTAQQTATKARQRPVPYVGALAALGAAITAVVLVRRRQARARAGRWWSR